MMTTPVQGADTGLRACIPTPSGPGGRPSREALHSIPRRMCSVIMTDGRAASSSCLDPPRARRPSSSGWFE